MGNQKNHIIGKTIRYTYKFDPFKALLKLIFIGSITVMRSFHKNCFFKIQTCTLLLRSQGLRVACRLPHQPSHVDSQINFSNNIKVLLCEFFNKKLR